MEHPGDEVEFCYISYLFSNVKFEISLGLELVRTVKGERAKMFSAEH